VSNTTSIVDFSIPLTTFLTTAISDGTWADVFGDLKFDRVGYEAAASQIAAAGGQLWSNGLDDMFKSVWALNPGRKDYTLSTSGAVTDSQVIATLDTNGDLWRIAGIVTGRSASTGEVASARIGGHFYRDGGTVLPLDVTHTIVQVGFATVDAELDIDGDDVVVLVTGEAGFDITWHVRIDHAEQIS
jgi:hypothetical protein